MTTYSDKFASVESKLSGFNGETVTRTPVGGPADAPITAWAVVETRVERRGDPNGSERFVRVMNMRLVKGATVVDDDTWSIRGEVWNVVAIVIKDPSVRVFLERPVDRTAGGPTLKDFSA